MKKHLLSLLIFAVILILPCSLNAADRYWVGGSGNWNNQSHWSPNSGGMSGASIPTANDNVIFDVNSFNNYYEQVVIGGEASCNSMFWTADVAYPKLAGAVNSKLNIYGSITLSTFMSNEFNGDIYFKSTASGNTINTAGHHLNSNVFFEGDKAIWTLKNHLFLSKTKNILLLAGNLFTNNKYVQAGSFVASGKANMSLSLGNSVLIFEQNFDISPAKKIKYNPGKAKIHANQSSNLNLSAKSINQIDSIWITVTQPLCNTSCDGVITVDSVFMSPQCSLSFVFTGGGLPPGGVSGNPISNMCAGTYLLTITDSCTLDQFQQFVVVTAPPPMGNTFGRKRPTCFGDCNGFVTSTVIGGTPPYTHLWNITGTTGPKDSLLCASPAPNSILLTVTDFNGCSQTFTTNLTQPQQIIPNASFTNISCNAFCDGTATVNPTGGALTTDGLTPNASAGGYTYSWNTSPAQTTQSIANLCPGTYIVTVTDDSLCVGIDSVTIAQPNPLVLNPSSTNVSCGGAGDGSAGVAPTGGTLPYTYTWTPPAVSTGPTASNLGPGTYTVVVIDSLGCTDSASFVITEPPVLDAGLISTDVTCFGACNGTATSTPTGGTPPYNFTWSNGAPPSTGLADTISNLCPGQYIVTVTDANLCTDQDTITITEPNLLTATATATDMTCNGVCDGTATVVIAGGTPGYSVLWSNGGTGLTITGLCDTTYSVIITDANGCQAFDTVTVVEPTLLIVNVNDANVSCSGLCDGQLSAIVGGGTPGYSYLWNNTQTTNPATNLCVGTYSVIVTDTNGCTSSDTANINNPSPIIPNVTFTNATCNGVCDGTATANPTGGTGPYTYFWSPGGQITQTVTGLCGDSTYTVTVTDNFGCSQTQTITIGQPPVFTSTAAVTNVGCFGDSTGQITLTLGGGTPGYNVSWSTTPAQTGLTATNLIAGTYTATIVDSNGCSYTHTETITEPAILDAALTSTNVICNGDCDGTATSTPTGGVGPYNFTWLPAGSGPPSTGLTATISGLCPGQYIVTVTDANGCVDADTVFITQPPALNAIITNTGASCNLVCDGSATVTAGGGTPNYTYQWYTVTPFAALVGYTNPTATGLCVGDYIVIVTDSNLCTISLPVTISALVNIIINPSGGSISCFGACDGSATASASGGTSPYTYSWNTIPPDTNQTVFNLCAGTYTVTVTDANGCSNTSSVTFSNPPALTNSFSNVNNALCGNVCDGSATANGGGGTGTLSYNWSNGPSTATANNLCAGTHIVTITDQNNCTLVDSVIITAPPTINPNANVTGATCGAADGSITLNPSGGTPSYTYQWLAPPSTANPLTNLAAGVYTVVITDSVLCTDTFNILVNNVNGPTLATSTTPASCNGVCDGTATVNATGVSPPFTYSWNTSPAQTDSIATGLCAGIYIVTVTDSLGCISNIQDTVIQPPPIVSNPFVTDVTCSGFCNGSIFLSPSGGNGGPYTFLWQGGQTTPFLSGLCPGNYIVTITDGSGACSITDTINVGAAIAISPNPLSSNVTCNGACNGFMGVNPTGGNPPYSYTWSNSGPNAPSQSNVCPNFYSVTITDSLGCTVTQNFTITEPPVLSATITTTDVDCFGACNGTASVTASGGSGGYTYFWTGSPGGTTPSVSGLCAGSYTVTIADSAAPGCSISLNIVITEPSALTVSVTGTDLICNGICSGTATAVAAGGTGPYTYTWSPAPLPPGGSQSGLCAGTYTVTVTDANLCSVIDSVVITQPTLIVANSSFTNASCNGVCDGTATVNPTGGTPGYTYSWTPGGQTTNTVSGLCAGNYSVDITDANGCVVTENFVITEPTAITPNLTTYFATCGVCDGAAVVAPTGGGGTYTYLWGNGSPLDSVSALCAGMDSVIITSSGCSITVPVPISNFGGPTTSHVFTNAVCNGNCNGTATVSATGVNNPFTYLWTPGLQTDSTVTTLCAGTYNVQVTDTLSCVSFETVIISEPAPVQGNPVVTDVSCTGICDGEIDLFPTGGNSVNFTYVWTPASLVGPNEDSLCAGIYSVIITDSLGCSGFDTMNVIVPNPLIVSQSSTNITCNGFCDGSATVTISGGTTPYTVVWSTGVTHITVGISTISGLCPGPYTATVTDANGCTITMNFNITEPSTLLSNAAVNNVSCNGACDGNITINPSGGTAPYTYSGGSLTNLCPGLYNVVITDANGCSLSQNFTITEPAVLTATISGTNVSCNGACDGTATVTPGGGTAPYFYLWGPGGFSTVPNPSALCAGNYTVLVTDSNGCTFNAAISITQPPAITMTDTVTNAVCGVCDGVATVTPAGGSLSPYTIVWSNGDTGVTADSLCAGLDTVYITDNSGCMQLFTIPISNVAGPVLSSVSTDATCNGSCNGIGVVSIVSGTGPYTYSWSPGAYTTDSVGTLCAGTYFVTVTDPLGCITIETIVINEPPVLLPNSSSTDATCGVCDGTASLAPTGGVPPYSYIWGSGATTDNVSGLCAGVHPVSITDSVGCSVTVNISINDIGGPTGSSQVTNPVSCFGANDGSSTVNATGGTAPYNYLWVPAGQATNAVTGLSSGSYNVQVIDNNGCSMVIPVVISEPSQIIANATVTSATCGACDGAISLAPTGGTGPYTYLWGGGQTTSSLTNLCDSIYTVVITDANGCTDSISIPVNGANGPALAMSNTNLSCNGVCDGMTSVIATGGSGNYGYSWPHDPLNLTGSASNLCAGTYFVQVTDSVSGCSSFASVTITQPSSFSFSVPNVADASCGSSCDGSATLLPVGGTLPYTYNWSPGGQTSQTATGLCAGLNIATVTDANGCAASQSVTIGQSLGIVANSSSTNATCGDCDGTATVAPSGGTPPYTVLWGNGSTSNTITGLCAGVHPVTISDSSGCPITVNIAVGNNGGPTGETITVTDVSCFGANDGTASVTPIGGTAPYNYLWVPGGQTTNTLTGMAAGTYHLEMEDSSGCIRIAEVIINGPSEINVNSVVTNADCGINNGSISLLTSGGVAPYVYSGAMTSSSASGLGAGLYNVTVTDANGCAQAISVQVSNTSGPALTVSSSNVSCNSACDGTAGVVAAGGSGTYSYLWSSPGNPTTPNVSSLCPGTYFVQVTDLVSLCSSFASVTITEPDTFYFSIPNMADALCGGACNGAATVVPTGGTLSYTYLWGNSETAQTASALCAGSTSVTITDASGCSATQTVTISEPLPIAIDSIITTPSCSNVNDGAIDITPSGGTGPGTYTYQWSGNATDITEDLINIFPGTYTISVTDNNGCQDSLTIIVLPAMTISANAGPDTTFCEGSGPVMLTGQGGTTYEWFVLPGMISVGTDSTVSVNPAAGATSYVLASSVGPCVAYDTITVNVSPLPVANAGPDVSILATESISIGGTPTGTSGSTYLWTPSEGLSDATIANPLANPAETTTFYVTVTDPNGCSNTDSVEVSIVPSIIFPNGITVNGDGVNDVWIIDNIELFPLCLVEVYNRWGELLFTSPGYVEKWDGTFKGKELPVGTYYYVIDLKDERFEPFTGPITIMR